MKLILKLAAVLVLVCVLLGVGVGALIDPAAVLAVSKGVTSATGCNTTLQAADIGLFSGHVKFEQLEIANPPGFRDGALLSMGEFEANWSTLSLFSDEVQVQELELDGLLLALELKGNETNLTPLLERLRELSGSEATPGAPEPDPKPAQETSEAKRINIQRVRIAGLQAELFVSDLPAIAGQYAVEVPEFTIDDLGNGQNSGTVSEWSARILESLLEHTHSAADGQFPAEWQSLLSGDLNGLRAAAREQLEGQATDFLDEHAGDLPPEVRDGLEGLIKPGGGLDNLLGGK